MNCSVLPSINNFTRFLSTNDNFLSFRYSNLLGFIESFPLGRYCYSKPLIFSFDPHSQGCADERSKP